MIHWIDENTFIQGNYKIINGTNPGYASWGAYFFPNSTTPKHPIDGTELQCTNDKPCLFHVVNLLKRFDQVKKAYYTNNEKKDQKYYVHQM